MGEALWEFLLHLMVLSLMAIGGINVILVELHRIVVVSGGWLTESDFTSLYALAQASPGPNMLFITLIGWRMAGIPGGLLATLAFITPSMLLAGVMARLWNAWSERRWFQALKRGLVPLTIGLMVASAWLVTNAAATGWASYAITIVAAAVTLRAGLHPLWILGGAAVLGVVGVV